MAMLISLRVKRTVFQGNYYPKAPDLSNGDWPDFAEDKVEAAGGLFHREASAKIPGASPSRPEGRRRSIALLAFFPGYLSGKPTPTA